jgi:hypothetical protein
MVDPKVQERFTRRCTDAAFGYGEATTAAYAAFAGHVLDFWAGVLSPESKPKPAPTAWGWPVRQEPMPLPFAPFMWAGAPSMRAMTLTPFPFAAFPFASGQQPFQAWLGLFPFASAPAAWPMAFMMIASGMPSSVAWPTAEANVAAIDAAGAAAVTVRQAFASYRSEGGHTLRQISPPEQLMRFAMVATLVPLGLGSMLAHVRMP